MSSASRSCAVGAPCREPVLQLVKELLEAGKRRLAGDTARAAAGGEVEDLRQEAEALKEVVASRPWNWVLKKSMIADGDGEE